MHVQESYDKFADLWDSQCDVLETDSDYEAFIHGLARFTSLTRVVITPSAHGRPFVPFSPLYETPMIRSLPTGLNYPIPFSWPVTHDWDELPLETVWNGKETDNQEVIDMLKQRWRGFRAALQTLAYAQHQVTELVIDVNHLRTGISARIFTEPCEEYDNMVRLLKRPGFRRLDLSLMVGGEEKDNWACFCNGNLRKALQNASNLQHLSLRTDVSFDLMEMDHIRMDDDSDASDWHYVPLRTIFPVNKLQSLVHFGLSNFLVKDTNIVSLLSGIPGTLRSVELSFLRFCDNGGNIGRLVAKMKNGLRWNERPEDARPKVTIGVHLCFRQVGRAIWVTNEVDDFLYRTGFNPFSKYGVADWVGVVRDAFNPKVVRHRRDRRGADRDTWGYWEGYGKLK
ncbi:unnamed protein product [Clonostachys rosea]|uniref:F-box domain-containing protein n=1 Tax=Bionectria ochroleuca TaxID=29856 RepID=A0ABY6TSD6_BIOOC|nr:unnamed protein product [Clonostachys rosea]